MAMSAQHAITTIEDLLALPSDGLRHELLDGDHAVTPAPSVGHQVVVVRLLSALKASFASTDLAVLASPADIHLGPRTLVQPDVFAIRLPDDWSRASWGEIGIPCLAIEVISPASARRDRGIKRDVYLSAGVEEYWIVDIDSRLVERWRAGDEKPEIAHTELRWSLRVGASGVLSVAALFADRD
jgi:Uma2 family endonuclease